MNEASDRLPLTLIAIQYLHHAMNFFNAAQQLRATHPLQWPKYFLLCHAIEVGLKAHLIGKGATPEDMKKQFGHKLWDLLDKAKGQDLQISDHDIQSLKLLHEAHTKYWPRYPKEDSTPIFVIDQFVEPIRRLLDTVSVSTTRGTILHDLKGV
jgi:hypothetical protein